MLFQTDLRREFELCLGEAQISEREAKFTTTIGPRKEGIWGEGNKSSRGVGEEFPVTPANTS